MLYVEIVPMQWLYLTVFDVCNFFSRVFYFEPESTHLLTIFAATLAATASTVEATPASVGVVVAAACWGVDAWTSCSSGLTG